MTGGRLVAASFLGGFAVMVLELAAVRVLAPWFGDSAYVWTNAIGVLLASMAVGAWIGGRISRVEDPGPPPDGEAEVRRDGVYLRDGTGRLSILLILGAGWASSVPLFAGQLSAALLPDSLTLEGAGWTLTLGSLGATTLLFAPPVLLASAASPVLVSAIVRRGRPVGQAAGLVATWSTLGSLVGTFGATHLLIPGLGSRWAVWIAAFALFGAASLVRGRRSLAAVALLPIVIGLLPQGPLRPAKGGVELLAERESKVQFLQVQRVDGTDQVQLKINEGLDSFQSVRVTGEDWTGGLYYDYHALAPFLAFDGEPDRALSVLSLGSAAGTFGEVYASAFPGVRLTSVEIDPEVVDLGRKFFGAYDHPGQEVFAGLDARVFVNNSDESFDVVLVDAYERQVYLPAHVVSREFFTAVKERLREGGVVSVNVGGRSFADPVLQAVGRTVRRVFGEARALRVPGSRNYVVVARKSRALDPSVLGSLERRRPRALVRVLERSLSLGAWSPFRGEGSVLEDDRPFLDELQDAAYRSEPGTSVLVSFAGDVDADVALSNARQAIADRTFERALAEASRSREETAQLRLLCGQARFDMGDVDGSRAEYLRAQEWLASQTLPDPADQKAVRFGLAFFDQIVAGREDSARARQRSLGLFFGTILLVGLVLWRWPKNGLANSVG